MDRFECVPHHLMPAPKGLVALFLVRGYAVEPSAQKAYDEALAKRKAAREARRNGHAGTADQALPEVPDLPKHRAIYLTKEMDVVAIGTYDIIQYEDQLVRSSKELHREREAGPLVLWDGRALMSVTFIDHHMREIVFLGLELNGQPYGSRFHLNARTDLGATAPDGYSWIDNIGKSLEASQTYGPEYQLHRMPTLYPFKGVHEKPLEEGSRFILDWETDRDWTDHAIEECVVDVRFDRKEMRRRDDAEFERQAYHSAEAVLARARDSFESEKQAALQKLQARLEAEYKVKLDDVRQKIEAKVQRKVELPDEG